MYKKPKHELSMLIIGVLMLVAGCVMFFSRIGVSSGFGNFSMFGRTMSLGVFFVPFILGLVCMVLFSKKMWPKVLTVLSMVAMIVAFIASLNLRYYESLTYTIICLVLIFVGGALCIKVLVIDDPDRGSGPGRL